jgi:hypothetical protein
MGGSGPEGQPIGEEVGPVKNVRRAVGESGQHRRVERLLIVRSQDDADEGAAGSELEDLP